MSFRRLEEIICGVAVLLILAQVALIVLRATDTIIISWWLVLIPTWILMLDIFIGLFIKD